MSISRLFLWVYRLSSGGLLFLLFLGTLFLFLLRKQERLRQLFPALLLIWTTAVLWVTLFNRSSGTLGDFQWLPLHSYREMFLTGNREILRSNMMNVALFYPGGLLLAVVLPKERRISSTMAILLLYSISIELIQQALYLGRGEIDDVLHNTLGAWLGCIALSLEPKLFPTRKKE